MPASAWMMAPNEIISTSWIDLSKAINAEITEIMGKVIIIKVTTTMRRKSF